MLTQCPHCLTFFRVGPDHLKAAAGRVRCCRCHKVFNALQRLEESPAFFKNPPLTNERQEIDQVLQENGLDTSTEPAEEQPQERRGGEAWLDFGEQPPDDDFKPMLQDLDPAATPDDLLEDILERDDGLDPEPDYFAAGTESQMSELLDQDSSSLLLPDSEEPGEEPQNIFDNIVTFSAADEQAAGEEETSDAQDFTDSILKDKAIDEELGRPDYDSVPAFRMDSESPSQTLSDADNALTFTAVKLPKQRSRSSLWWLIGSLLLLPPLAGQVAWQFRDDLIQHEAGRQTLNLLCRVAGCKVPVRRAVDKIIIQGRNLSSHPDKPDTLFLQVSIVNTAAFEQPFPKLTLSLYNDKGSLLARRTFSAEDYLPPEYAQLKLMPQAQPILVEMELVDPGKEVTGFSFDFF